jgi:hypothetical protein
MTIKNGNLPAMPFTQEPYPIGAIPTRCGAMAVGLTKREQFAVMAMQGLLAKHGDDDYQCEQIASYAAAHADALLKELERTK